MKRIILIILLCTASVFAQEAKVIQLTSQDATEAKHLYDELQAAQDRYSRFRVEIENRYTRIHSKDCPLASGLTNDSNIIIFNGNGMTTTGCHKPGWSDFTFSEDFKFIVPKPVQSITGTIPYSPCLKLSTDSAIQYSAP